MSSKFLSIQPFPFVCQRHKTKSDWRKELGIPKQRDLKTFSFRQWMNSAAPISQAAMRTQYIRSHYTAPTTSLPWVFKNIRIAKNGCLKRYLWNIVGKESVRCQFEPSSLPTERNSKVNSCESPLCDKIPPHLCTVPPRFRRYPFSLMFTVSARETLPSWRPNWISNEK